jgi:hypothetical protein
VEIVAAALADHVDDEAVTHGRGGVDAAGLHLGVLNRLGAQARAVDVEVVVVARVETFHQRHGVAVLDGIAEVVLAAARIVVRARDDARRQHQKVAPEFPFDDGASFWNSASIVSTLLGLVTSSIGASPETVIDSSSAPSSIGHVDLEVAAGAQQDAFAARNGETRPAARSP